MTISWANFEKLFQYGTMFQQGMIVTILLAACTVFFGFILAFLLALMLLSDVRPFRHLEKIKTEDIQKKKRYDRIAAFYPVRLLANAYVQFVRCTPMLVQIFLVYYIIFGFITLPKFTFFGFIQFERFFPAAVAMALNSGGYMSAVIRGGIEGVDAGQTEAARSLGMTKSQTMFHIILPQAVKNILPAVANEKSVQSATFIIAEPLIMATLLYFCLCFPTSKIIEYIERRMRQSDNR